MAQDRIWLKWMPGWLAERFRGRNRLQAMAGNSAWLLIDRILRLATGLLVGVWMTRHLGPAGFGQLSFAIAFAGFFTPLATLGMEQMVMRRLVQRPSRWGAILGTVVAVRLLGALSAAGVTLAAHAAFWPDETDLRWMICAVVAAQIFLPFDFIDLAFQAAGRADLGVKARWWSLGLGALWRLGLILAAKGPAWFAWAMAGEALIGALAVLWFWRAWKGGKAPWSWSKSLALSLLKATWPLALSVFLVGITMRMGQVLLHRMLGDSELGYYAVAVRMAELWFFVPMTFSAAAFPQLLAIRKERGQDAFDAASVKLFRALIWMGLGAALGLSTLGPWVLVLLYGETFRPSVAPFLVLAWSGLFVGLGVAKEQWLVQRGLTVASLGASLGGAILNVGCNLILLPRIGSLGAAWSTLISLAAANMLLLTLHPRTRPLFWIQFKALKPGFSRSHAR